jgi:xylonate dehydratase
MMMALAAQRDLPCVLVPGGVTLPPTEGEDAGKVQTIGARFAQGEITLEEAAELGCRACASPAAAASSSARRPPAQVVAEALGPVPAALGAGAFGQPIWLDMARRSAQALMELEARASRRRHPHRGRLHNAMVVHAAFGGSTNLLLHLPAIAHAAGCRAPPSRTGTRSTAGAAPGGRAAQRPVGHPTVRSSWPAACPR